MVKRDMGIGIGFFKDLGHISFPPPIAFEKPDDDTVLGKELATGLVVAVADRLLIDNPQNGSPEQP